MRTTLDIDDDILFAVKEIARRDRASAGSVLSELARRSLTGQPEKPARRAARDRNVCGFVPFPKRPGIVVTNEMIDRLRDVEGV